MSNNQKTVVAVGAFIFDGDGRVFLGKFREKFQKKWSIPGGKIDFKETPLEAVKREVKEETNIDLESVEFFRCGAFTIDFLHVVYLDFIASCPEGSEIRINDEFSTWGFFGLDEIEELDLIAETKDLLIAGVRHFSTPVFDKATHFKRFSTISYKAITMGF